MRSKISLLLSFIFSLLISFPSLSQQIKTTIVLKTSNLPKNSKIYIVGNISQLGQWDFMKPMEKLSENEWSFKIDGEYGDTVEYKFTRGNWRTEAVDSNGLEFPNFVHVIKYDTTIIYSVSKWRDQVINIAVISLERLQNKGGSLELYEGWKYKIGDDTSWANPSFDDENWKTINPLLNEEDFKKLDWSGNIWFRNTLIVDSSLYNKPLSFYFLDFGAAEVYLNGKLLYKYGEVGTSIKNETNYIERNPRSIIFEPEENHVIAIRYSNFRAQEILKYKVPAGFVAILGNINESITRRVKDVREYTIHQFGTSALLLAFAVMHFLLFVFYPKGKENLFYSISMLAFSIVVYSGVRTSTGDSIFDTILFSRINNIAVLIAILFGLLTVYVSSYKKIPKQAYVFSVISLIFIIHISFTTQSGIDLVDYSFFALCILMTLEIIRVMIVSIWKKETWGWSWIIGLGFTVALLTIIYQILISVQVIQQPLFGIYLVYIYGIMFLAITVSINLSKRVADTNKDLEKQLEQVKELSEKTIEQERKAKDEEIARRLLEADNERKTKELEEARSLQLSMLPKKIPSLKNLEISVYMKPASEVGGDYYDFKYDDHNSLTVAIGDATGHGMKAGTMVATIKGLFSAEPIDSDSTSFFNKCNSIIKEMDLGNLFMAMLIAKIEGNKMSFVSAGMPPILIYRKTNKLVEELRFPGLPLGAALQNHYAENITILNTGDTILFMSDGFPELFNDKKEILDYDKANNIFASIAEKSSDEIINKLYNEVDIWKNGADQQDDITFVVIKVK
jgi:serine phosphatase RsbU (regulator of sigma subunit)